jgi:antitoxin component YwqK of YwqJK toxin-antitoxin module
MTTAYYESGNKSRQAIYSNGSKDGEFESWYDDGNPREKITYKNGKKEGKFIVYHANGKILAKAFYENDYIKNLEDAKTYWDNGNLAQEAKQVGPTYVSIFTYDLDGKAMNKYTQGTNDNHFEIDISGYLVGPGESMAMICKNCFGVGGQGDFPR